MSHKSLWQVGVDYLDYCPNEGRARLEALLSRIPFRTDEKALKIIQIARDRDLSEVGESFVFCISCKRCILWWRRSILICLPFSFFLVYTVGKVQGMRHLARGNLGAALMWSMRCQDSVFSCQIADKYLKNYIAEGKFTSIDLLQNLGSGIMLSDRLAFLGTWKFVIKAWRA